jgi:hypothetical protein
MAVWMNSGWHGEVGCKDERKGALTKAVLSVVSLNILLGFWPGRRREDKVRDARTERRVSWQYHCQTRGLLVKAARGWRTEVS